MDAACLAALANSTKNAVITTKSRAAYSAALRMTNSVLQDTRTAVKDSTLISVIMLGLYENFAFGGERSIEAWAAHVRGARALLNPRGTQQFESDTARRIFHQFFGIIPLLSLESGMGIPDDICELYNYCNLVSDYTLQGHMDYKTCALFARLDRSEQGQRKRSSPTDH